MVWISGHNRFVCDERMSVSFAMQSCLLTPNQAFKSALIITSVARSFSSNGKLFHTIVWPPPPALVLWEWSKPNIDSLTTMTMLPHNHASLRPRCPTTTPPVLLCSPPFPGPTFPSWPSPSPLYYKYVDVFTINKQIKSIKRMMSMLQEARTDGKIKGNDGASH